MLSDSPHLDRIFFALSDPTRRALVSRLAEGPATVGRLAAPFPISAPAISKHLKILERAGLIHRRVAGREHHCTLEPRALGEAGDWVGFHRRFWEARLEELEKLLESAGDGPEHEPEDPTEKETP